MFCTALAVAHITSQSQGNGELVRMLDGGVTLSEIYHWFSLLVLSLAFYIQTAFLPIKLSLFVETPQIIEPLALIKATILIGILIICTVNFWKNKFCRFGLVFSLLVASEWNIANRQYLCGG